IARTGPIIRKLIRTEKPAMSAINRTFRLAASLLICVGIAGLPACKKEAGSVPTRSIPEVEVVTVTTQSVPDEPEFIGQTESSRPVEIRPQVTGLIKERSFAEGRAVKKGDRLYQIDPVPFKAALLHAKTKWERTWRRRRRWRGQSQIWSRRSLISITPLSPLPSTG